MRRRSTTVYNKGEIATSTIQLGINTISGAVNTGVTAQILSLFRPCMVKAYNNGAAVTFLNDDWSYDDSTMPDRVNGTEGDLMIRIPEFYYQITIDNGQRTCNLELSLKPIPGFIKVNESLLGAARASFDTNTGNMRSLYVTPQTITDNGNIMMSRAKSVGNGFTCVTWEQHCILVMCYYMKYGTYLWSTNFSTTGTSGENPYSPSIEDGRGFNGNQFMGFYQIDGRSDSVGELISTETAFNLYTSPNTNFKIDNGTITVTQRYFSVADPVTGIERQVFWHYTNGSGSINIMQFHGRLWSAGSGEQFIPEYFDCAPAYLSTANPSLGNANGANTNVNAFLRRGTNPTNISVRGIATLNYLLASNSNLSSRLAFYGNIYEMSAENFKQI